MNIGLITKALNWAGENPGKYNTGVLTGGMLSVGPLVNKQYRQRAADIEQIQKFMKQNFANTGSRLLTQSQRLSENIKGSKIPNWLYEQAYGDKGSWWKYLTKRTNLAHLGPVEGLAKWGGRLLGASGVPLLAYEMLGKEAGQEKWLGSDPAAGWQKEMIDPTFSGLPVGMKGGTHSSSDNTGDSSTPSNTRNVRPSGGNINTGSDTSDSNITTANTTGSGVTTTTSGATTRPTGVNRTTNVTTQTRPTIITNPYVGDRSGRKAKPKAKSFAFEDTKSRASRTPTRSRTATPTVSRVRPGYGKPPIRPGGR